MHAVLLRAAEWRREGHLAAAAAEPDGNNCEDLNSPTQELSIADLIARTKVVQTELQECSEKVIISRVGPY